MTIITRKKITKLLDSFGFKHSNSGYMYIVDILKDLCDGKISRQYISAAYESVAAKHGTTTGNVEKSVRFAIKNSSQCFMLSNKEFLYQLFDQLILEEEDLNEEEQAKLLEQQGG